jgi:5-methylcytosine-specific restriction endonuclease McrA
LRLRPGTNPTSMARHFYQRPPWRRLRAAALRLAGYRCCICGCDVSGKGRARVDHIKARDTHPHLALVLANTRVLCPEHDNMAHREKGTGKTERDARFVDRNCAADGMPLDPMHPWRIGR